MNHEPNHEPNAPNREQNHKQNHEQNHEPWTIKQGLTLSSTRSSYLPFLYPRQFQYLWKVWLFRELQSLCQLLTSSPECRPMLLGLNPLHFCLWSWELHTSNIDGTSSNFDSKLSANILAQSGTLVSCKGQLKTSPLACYLFPHHWQCPKVLWGLEPWEHARYQDTCAFDDTINSFCIWSQIFVLGLHDLCSIYKQKQAVISCFCGQA